MIREGKVHQIDGLLQSSENAGTGMISLDTCLLNYMRQGIITVEDGLRIAKDPEHLRQMTLDIAED
jgi:Tfp pilus assembly pilus retraction ATPase PilT